MPYVMYLYTYVLYVCEYVQGPVDDCDLSPVTALLQAVGNTYIQVIHNNKCKYFTFTSLSKSFQLSSGRRLNKCEIELERLTAGSCFRETDVSPTENYKSEKLEQEQESLSLTLYCISQIATRNPHPIHASLSRAPNIGSLFMKSHFSSVYIN